MVMVPGLFLKLLGYKEVEMQGEQNGAHTGDPTNAVGTRRHMREKACILSII